MHRGVRAFCPDWRLLCAGTGLAQGNPTLVLPSCDLNGDLTCSEQRLRPGPEYLLPARSGGQCHHCAHLQGKGTKL